MNWGGQASVIHLKFSLVGSEVQFLPLNTFGLPNAVLNKKFFEKLHNLLIHSFGLTKYVHVELWVNTT